MPTDQRELDPDSKKLDDKFKALGSAMGIQFEPTNPGPMPQRVIGKGVDELHYGSTKHTKVRVTFASGSRKELTIKGGVAPLIPLETGPRDRVVQSEFLDPTNGACLQSSFGQTN